jgi:hypothetical protein
MKLVLSLCLLLMSDAGAQEIKPCPDQFPVEAVKLAPLPNGWIGIAPSKLPLTSADVMVGPPQPAAAIGQQHKTRTGYEVVFDATSAKPEQKWLACRYGDLALAQRLPDDIDRCTISYHRRPAYNDYDIQVACHTAPKSR